MVFAAEDYAVFILYFGLILIVGSISSRSRSDATEFLLAGRSLTLPIFVMTLVSSWYGGILGVGEFSYLYGISNWVVQGVPYYLFAFLFAFLLAKRIRETNLMTIPDRLEQVYDRKTALLGGFLTFLLTSPAPYVLMMGILMQVILGWPVVWCILTGAGLTIVYLFYGGLRADIYTDMVEFILMFLGFGIAIPFAVVELGGFQFLSQNLPPLHLTWHGGNPIQFILVWFMIALWTLVDPSFHQRCYAAKSGETARKGILLSIPFWFLFDAMTATTGLYARAALSGIEQPVMAFPLFAERVLPPLAKGLFYVGMLATVMSTLNTMTLISATSLGRDIVWRFRGGGEGVVNRYTRWGLFITSVVSIVLCLLVPSVIGLWYVIGTAIIPGLLIPLVTSYFEKWRVTAGYAFTSMLTSWMVSTGWLIGGWGESVGSSSHYPFGIEPMFPGLVVSMVVWGVGAFRRKSETRHRQK
jgi:SSS family solute:Na+ symporter